MPEAITAAYAQVLGLGLLWTSVHCSGMCGPLLIGLDVAGVAQGTTAPRGALQVLLYQAGRGLTYALLGGLAGAIGAGLASLFETAGALVALLLGAGVAASLLVALHRRMRPKLSLHRATRTPDWTERPTHWLTRAVSPLAGTGRPLHLLALGGVMGLLPCMITAWVLALAATTGSVLHGAALMLVLLALTTPVLLGVTLLPRALPALRRAAWLPSFLKTISATWLVLIGLAGLGIVAHQHVVLELASGNLVVMLW